jgi:uncharacterized membrane protein
VTALLRSALAGAATGGRAFTGVAALTLATPSRPLTQPDQLLSKGWVKGLAALLAVQELALDKLPQAPSRLKLPGLGMRCVSAAGAGLIIARRAPEAAGPDGPPAPGPVSTGPVSTGPVSTGPVSTGPVSTVACVAVATATAVGASFLGAKWRGWAAGRTGRDYVGAGLEDTLAVGLATLSLRV